MAKESSPSLSLSLPRCRSRSLGHLPHSPSIRPYASLARTLQAHPSLSIALISLPVEPNGHSESSAAASAKEAPRRRLATSKSAPRRRARASAPEAAVATVASFSAASNRRAGLITVFCIWWGKARGYGSPRTFLRRRRNWFQLKAARPHKATRYRPAPQRTTMRWGPTRPMLHNARARWTVSVMVFGKPVALQSSTRSWWRAAPMAARACSKRAWRRRRR